MSEAMDAVTSQAALTDSQIVTEVQWPLALSGLNMDRDILALLFVGELTHGALGIPYLGTSQVIRLDVQVGGFYWNVPSREILPAFGGTIPVVLAPIESAQPGQPFSGGVWWERASIAQGWWYQDWPGADGGDPILGMPPGPQSGQAFTRPDWFLADVLFAAGYFGDSFFSL